MIRNPYPNRELDREPYWNLDEISLTVIVRIRQNVEHFHQTADRCPKCGAKCWEAEQTRSSSAAAPVLLWLSLQMNRCTIVGFHTYGLTPYR